MELIKGIELSGRVFSGHGGTTRPHHNRGREQTRIAIYMQGTYI